MDETTTRSATQEQLDELVTSPSFVAAMLDAIQAGIVACDADGTLVLFNATTRTFHGLPQERLPAEDWAEHYDLFHADGITPMAMADVPLFRALQGEEVSDVGMVIAPSVGRRRTLRASGQQIVDVDGSVLGAVVAMHDVSELLDVQRELQQERERLQAAEQERVHVQRLRSLQESSVRVLAAGDARDAMSTLAHETVTLLGPGQVTVAWPVHEEQVVVTAGGRPGRHTARVELTGVTESYGWLELRAEREIAEDDRLLLEQLGTLGLHAMRAARLRAQLAAAETARLRDELMAAVSHDMQTPLAAVVGLAETLEARDGALEADDRNDVVVALGRQASQLRMLAGQFLDYTRLSQAAELALRVEAADVAEIVADVARLHGHTGRVTAEMDATPTAELDADRVQRVVSNLVSNALAYAEGPVVVRLRASEDEVIVEVLDDGPGLGPDPEELFGKFARGGTSALHDGSGLGLYLGRAVAEAHGGTLVGSDRPEGGARFVLSLPRTTGT